MNEEVVEELQGGNQQEDASSDEPFVSTDGLEGIGLRKEIVCRRDVGANIRIDLGHDDRWRDGSRHAGE